MGIWRVLSHAPGHPDSPSPAVGGALGRFCVIRGQGSDLRSSNSYHFMNVISHEKIKAGHIRFKKAKKEHVQQ
eukprot:1058034-Pelagomonas_calceolata.AAC.4